jgi:hypothetical protein
MYSRPVKSMPGKPMLTAMATPDTGHAARANTFFGWGRISSTELGCRVELMGSLKQNNLLILLLFI